MNREAILHIPGSRLCFAQNENTVVLRLRTARSDDFDCVSVIYGGKYNFYKKQNKLPLTVLCTDDLFRYYQVKLVLDDVRLVYVFEIVHNGKKVFYSEDGLTDTFNFDLNYFNAFQLAYINSADVHREVEWMREAVFYHIFVDRFYRGNNKKNDGYINLKWGGKPGPKSFAGGDLKGITSKLGYLADLGINVLYITPIFCSDTNHKYDISDYFNVDRHFGSNEDFKELVEAAHSLGIRIVMDAVFNHCSDNLAQFQDVVENGKASPFYDWFIIKGEKPVKRPLNYECFASCNYMPKFNTSNKDLQNYLLSITTHWIRRYDIDGWRLDVSDEVSHNFWRKFREHVKELKEDCVIIGENWHDANPFLQGDQYDSIMNYAFTKACYDYFADDIIDAEGFAHRLNGLLMRNTDQVNAMMLNILDSHDTHRFLTLVKGNKDKLICALAVTFMYIGTPGIYYGTEIGIEGNGDPDNRRTFDWEKADSGTLIMDIIKKLTRLRKRNELITGDIEMCVQDGLFVLKRQAGQKSLKLTVNNTGTDVSYTASKGVPLQIESKPLLSHNFNGSILKNDGFIIEAEGKSSFS